MSNLITTKKYIVTIISSINKNTPEEWKNSDDFIFNNIDEALEFRAKSIESKIKYNEDIIISTNF